jgi:HSP20 family protein
MAGYRTSENSFHNPMRRQLSKLRHNPRREVRIMADERQRVAAEYCSYVDDATNALNLEISIPGVKKESIDLRVKDDSFHLVASREDYDYVTASAFCCPVNAKSAKASYEVGLLKVSLDFKDPFDDAYKVTVI